MTDILSGFPPPPKATARLAEAPLGAKAVAGPQLLGGDLFVLAAIRFRPRSETLP
jgi:hypothetical protein